MDIKERVCGAVEEGSAVTFEFLQSLTIGDPETWKKKTGAIFETMLAEIRKKYAEIGDHDTLRIRQAERDVCTTGLEKVTEFLKTGAFSLRGKWGVEDVQYTWEDEAGSGTYGKVAFLKAQPGETAAPRRIAIKYGITEKNLHEISVVLYMNRKDEESQSQEV